LGVNVTAGYFAQQRTDTLNSNATVLENMMDLRTNQNGLSEQKARMILGSFLFRNDDVFKKVSVLSGGEKSRLNLARLLIDPPNFLLMDEPTTHLDISSIDVMIHALKQYEGTLIFISHDVHFIRTLAENVLHVHAGRLTPYAGDYDYYLEKSKAKDARSGITAGFTDARPEQKKSASKVEVKPVGPAVSSNSRPSPNEIKKLRQEVSRLEEVVSKLEFKQSEITDALESPETYRDPGKAHHLNRELSAIVDQITAATAEWEAAGEKLFELEK
jgi:ATP-binding cassette, subfamily F, member 3